jgi:hypothetical protein
MTNFNCTVHITSSVFGCTSTEPIFFSSKERVGADGKNYLFD